MTTPSITTSTGTTISLEDFQGDRVVVIENPAAPVEIRRVEAGRVIEGGFQSAPFAAYAVTPETLRAIADLVEAEAAR